MKVRKATPNIMEELLNVKVSSSSDSISKTSIPEQNNSSIPEQNNTIVSEKHNTGIQAYQYTILPEYPSTGSLINDLTLSKPSEEAKSSEDNKTKATYYISQQLIEDIDQAWFDLRKLLKPTDRGKLSKSLLVELAVKVAVEDFRKNGKNSILLQQILNITHNT